LALSGLALASLVALLFVAREALAFAIVVAPNCFKANPASNEAVSRGTTVRQREAGVASILEPESPARGTIVLLHGVRMQRQALQSTAEAFVEAGYRAILVDLRGHGESGGRFLTYGVRESQDVSRLLDEVESRHLLQAPVGAYGFSYGGAVAIQLASRDRRIRAVTAVSTFSNVEQVVSDYARRYFPLLGGHVPEPIIRSAVAEAGAIAGFEPREADARDAAARARVPLLLMHGASDEQVRPYHSQALSRAAGDRATLIILPGETHASMLADEINVVRRRSVEWFEHWLGSPS
jgi:alpha-beta hydrolase superfamily lysophospholipase